MADYVKVHEDWRNKTQDLTTPATAEAFEHIEQGIFDAQRAADLAQAAADSKATPADIAAHNNQTVATHGIADTAQLETLTGAQNKANAAQAFAIQRANHTGTQLTSTLVETATAKVMTDVERTKLAGVTPGATANATDAQLRDRATHTGTQSADTLTDGATNKVLTAAAASFLNTLVTAITASGLPIIIIEYDDITGWPARPVWPYVVWWVNRFNTTPPAAGGTGYVDGVDLITLVSA